MINKKSWVYAGKLKRHTIELAHDLTHQKVYVRLNGILLYEESLPAQQSEKAFNFFIDDELCVLSIEKVGDKYAYRFTSPEYSSSSTAKLRKWKDRLLIVAIIFVFSSIFGGFGVPFITNIIRTNQLNNNLEMGGIVTSADMVKGGVIIDGEKVSLSYQYLAGLKQIKQHLEIPTTDSSYRMYASLLPVTDQSSFEVLYSASNPDIHRLLFQPSEKQLAVLKITARNACLKLGNIPVQGTQQQMVYCDCLIRYLFIHHRLEGLARIIKSSETPDSSPVYNKDTFKQFMDSALQTELQQICIRAANE